MCLLDGERFDDLQIKGLKIIQNKNKYCFTADAVLLAGFCKVKKGESVVDLGSGSGIISLLLAAKSKAKSITGVEFQSDMYEMSKRSIEYNNLEHIVKVINCDMRESYKFLGENNDIVVCNPPYFANMKLQNENENIAISRHEIKIDLEGVIESTAHLLKFGGKFFLIHKSERVAEIIYKLKDNKLEPKRIQFIQSLENLPPHLVLIESVKGGKQGVLIENNIIINNEDGSLTQMARNIYDKEEI